MDDIPSNEESAKDYATRRVSLEETESPDLTANIEELSPPLSEKVEEPETVEVVAMEASTPSQAEFSAVTKPIEAEAPQVTPVIKTVEESKPVISAAPVEGKRKDKNQSVLIAVVIAVCVVLLACICACSVISIFFVTNAPW
jgi:hypothetical protein